MPTTRKKSPTKGGLVEQELKALAHFPTKVRQTLSACNVQERKFIMAYAGEARGNATLAMKKAGHKGAYATMASAGCIMMQRPHVRAALDAWLEEYAVSVAEITRLITDAMYINPGPFTEAQPNGELHTKVPDADTWEAHKHWVKRIVADPKTGKVVELELHDSQQARRDMAKIRKLYSDQPIVAFNFHVRQMSDDDIIKALEEARMEEEKAAGRGPTRLPSGGPVAVVNG